MAHERSECVSALGDWPPPPSGPHDSRDGGGSLKPLHRNKYAHEGSAYAGCGFRYRWIACTTTDPSPTPEATRFTDPARTSPTAKTPGCEVQ